MTLANYCFWRSLVHELCNHLHELPKLFTALRVAFLILRGFHLRTASKDRHPFPVPLKTYDESLKFLRTSLDSARLGDRDKLDGFRRLERFVNAIETTREPEANFDAVIAHENSISASLNGRSVFDDKPRQRARFNPRQRSLF